MKRRVVSAVLMAGLAVAVSAASGSEKKLVLTGASTIAPLISEIGKRFEARNPGVRVDVQTGGSSRGIADAKSGLADIGMSSRALKDSEKDGLRSYPLAMDGVCFLIHKDNPVKALSDAQLLAIYTKKITDWKDVGGKPAPVTVVNRADGRSELDLLCQYFGVKPTDLKADVIVGDNEQGIKTVAGSPNAIVYMSVGTSEYDAGLGIPIKLLPLRGVAAGTASVANGTFPLTRPLLLLAKTDAGGLVKRFLDFALSADVHDLIREQSFVPSR